MYLLQNVTVTSTHGVLSNLRERVKRKRDLRLAQG